MRVGVRSDLYTNKHPCLPVRPLGLRGLRGEELVRQRDRLLLSTIEALCEQITYIHMI